MVSHGGLIWGLFERYPFVSEQREYMERMGSVSVKELKEQFEAFYIPLVVVAYRKSNSHNMYFSLTDVSCKADSRIYPIDDELVHFEYRYVQLDSVGILFPVPPEVEYTVFWLLPAKSLAGAVYLRGEALGERLNYFRIEVEQNELFVDKYVEQLQKRIEELKYKINELRQQ